MTKKTVSWFDTPGALTQADQLEDNISEDQYNEIYDILTEVSKMLSGLINKMLSK